MRTLSVILFLFLFQDGDRSIKGIVTFENDPMPGCIVTVVETGAARMCDADGAYAFYLPVNTKKITLEVSFPGERFCATTRVEDIILTPNETDLGRIPLFFNSSLGVDQYKTLSDVDKEDYEPIQHGNQVIAYMSKTKADTTSIAVYCKNVRTKIPYRYIAGQNKIVFNYKDFPPCP